jgi:hypothetical protein
MKNLVSIYVPVYDNEGNLIDMVLTGKLNIQKIDYIHYSSRICVKDSLYYPVHQQYYSRAFVKKEDADRL